MEESFATQLGVSAAGNVLTLFCALGIWLVKERCSKSHCKTKCHTGCIDVQLSDQTIRSISRPPDQPDSTESRTMDLEQGELSYESNTPRLVSAVPKNSPVRRA